MPVTVRGQRIAALTGILFTALAFSAAAKRLPLGATCVIARHAWHRDYFRAAYLLMPRRVWPAVDDPVAQITPSVLKAAVTALHADCLLARPGLAAPAGFRQVAGGAYALYVASGAARLRD